MDRVTARLKLYGLLHNCQPLFHLNEPDTVQGTRGGVAGDAGSQ